MQSSVFKPYAPFNLPPNNPESLRIRQAKFTPSHPLNKAASHKPLISPKSSLNQAYKRPLIIFKYFF